MAYGSSPHLPETEGQLWLSQNWNLPPACREPPGQHQSGNLSDGPPASPKQRDLVRSNPLSYLVSLPRPPFLVPWSSLLPARLEAARFESSSQIHPYNVQCASVYLLTALMPGESNPGKVPVSPVGSLLSRHLRRCWWALLRPRSWLQDEDVRTWRVSFSGLGPTEKLDGVWLGNQARCSLETDQVGPGNGPGPT